VVIIRIFVIPPPSQTPRRTASQRCAYTKKKGWVWKEKRKEKTANNKERIEMPNGKQEEVSSPLPGPDAFGKCPVDLYSSMQDAV